MIFHRLLRFFRTASVVVAITLAIDFVVTLFIPASVLDSFMLARERDREVYDDTVPWHHDLKPNVDMERVWGLQRYPYKTDAQGFRTGQCAQEPMVQGKSVFLIGDSFIEGLGLPFEETVAGLLTCAWKAEGKPARVLGVASYSPIIYWRKIAAGAEKLKVKPTEVVVFLDLCDIYDETTYQELPDGTLRSRERTRLDRTLTWLRHNFTTIGLLNEVRRRYMLATAKPVDALNRTCTQWTLNEEARKQWGYTGLARAAANLEKIVEQCRQWNCRMSLVVYPWPDQVAAGDRNSLHVTHWRAWAEKNGVRFVDAFGPFFTAPANEIIARDYIPGDIHFNAAGNRALFEEVWKTLGKP